MYIITVISVISSLCYLSLSIARVGPFVAGVFPLPGQVNEIKLPHFIVSVKQKNMSKYIFFKIRLLTDCILRKD